MSLSAYPEEDRLCYPILLVKCFQCVYVIWYHNWWKPVGCCVEHTRNTVIYTQCFCVARFVVVAVTIDVVHIILRFIPFGNMYAVEKENEFERKQMTMHWITLTLHGDACICVLFISDSFTVYTQRDPIRSTIYAYLCGALKEQQRK